MMENQTLYIVNPIAGQGAGERAQPEIDRLARENGMDYRIVLTERPGHAIELARQAVMDAIDTVIAVGGDGTSNEVLNGIMQAYDQGYRATTMGILAIGRGNDCAYGFGIPPGIEAGFQVINTGKSSLLDVGQVSGGDYPQGRYFGNGVGIGFDAVVGFEAVKLTHLHGFLNYVVAALRTIFLYFNAPHIRIEYDDIQLTQPALMVSIMNGRRMGGGFMMAPDARQDDGFFDLCIAGQLSRLGILAMIPRFMKGTQSAYPQITTGRAASIHIVAMDGTLPAHADGETVCIAGKELAIKIIPRCLRVLHG
jgi:diacylglycerol kinase (ATP)